MPHPDRAASPAETPASEVPGPAAEETAPAPEPPEIISHAEMNTARDQNLAEPLGQVIGYILRYLSSWWIPFEGGWIRADPALTAMLDAEAARMTAQDAIIARNAAIRAAVNAVQMNGDGEGDKSGDESTQRTSSRPSQA